MNWNAIGAAAEFIAAAGVIISLAYLAIQVRMYSADTRHGSIDRLVEIWSTYIGAVADHRDLALVWAKGYRDLSALDTAERRCSSRTRPVSSGYRRLFSSTTGMERWTRACGRESMPA